VDFTYGYVEARVKTSNGKGFLTALRLLPTDNAYGSWPRSGSVDIIVADGQYTENGFSIVHFGDPSETRNGKFGDGRTDLSADYHTYAVEWLPGEMIFYIDGEEYYMYFGNRNLNEYYSSIDSTQMNGRVITVMRSGLETMFAGNNDTVELETGQVIEKTEDPDNPLFRKNCLVYDPFEDYLTYDESEGLHEENPAAYDDNMVNEAEAFIKKILSTY
jgi:beta-glucanase (GH16 family)